MQGETLARNFIEGMVSVTDGGKTGSGAGVDPMTFGHQLHLALITGLLDAVANGAALRGTGEDAR